MSVPTNANRNWLGVTTVFTISGVTYAAVANIKENWGYRIHEELVTGSTDPYLGTGGFHGELRINGIASSDNRWNELATATSGIVTTFGVTWQGRDQQGIGSSGNRTYNASGKFTEFMIDNERDNFVKIEARMIMGREPTVVQS